jgi:membrane fusion protein, multidrug efflux system
MHDVAKEIPTPEAVKRRSKFVSFAIKALLILCAAFGTAALILRHVSTLVVIITVATVGAIFLALLSIRRFRSGRPLAGAVFGVVALFLVLADVKFLQFHTMASAPKMMPSVTVISAPVKEENWSPRLSAVGTVSAVEGAVVSTELGGTVSQIEFQNGADAKKGEVLVKLDASSEEAQLRTAEADLELARSDLERTRELAARKVVSKAELDAAQSKFQQKQGAVDNMRAVIQKKEVRAPFDGQLGIRQVNVGQMISAGQQVVQLTSLDPVYVDFALPEQNLLRLKQGLEVEVHVDALPGHTFKGKLTAMNSMVDAITRNVSVQATLQNPDHALHPGMFAKVDVLLPQKEKTLVIPGAAVSYAPYGDSVFVIEKNKDPKTKKETQTIRQEFVRIGEARGDYVSVTKGLKAGELVVGTGVFKLRNGMAVTIDNHLAPTLQENPNPPDS